MCKLIVFVGHEYSNRNRYCHFLASLGYQDLQFPNLTQEVLNRLKFYVEQNKDVCTCDIKDLADYSKIKRYCKNNNIELYLYYCKRYGDKTAHDQARLTLTDYVEDFVQHDLQKIDLSILDCSVLGKTFAEVE